MQYLNSDKYRNTIEDQLSFAGVTHKDRRNKGDVKWIGEDDKVLVNKNNVGYIQKIYPKDGYCWADIKLYDENKFSGEAADNIRYIKGMHEEGTKLPVSAVIDAVWDAYDRAKSITCIAGVDFTLNPAFGKDSKVREIII